MLFFISVLTRLCGIVFIINGSRTCLFIRLDSLREVIGPSLTSTRELGMSGRKCSERRAGHIKYIMYSSSRQKLISTN